MQSNPTAPVPFAIKRAVPNAQSPSPAAIRTSHLCSTAAQALENWRKNRCYVFGTRRQYSRRFPGRHVHCGEGEQGPGCSPCRLSSERGVRPQCPRVQTESIASSGPIQLSVGSPAPSPRMPGFPISAARASLAIRNCAPVFAVSGCRSRVSRAMTLVMLAG